MHTTRALLDAEALLLMSTGILAVLVPQAFVRILLPGTDEALVHVVVPWLGALAVGIAVLQRGITGLSDPNALRVVIHGRLVTDLLIAVTAMLYARGFGGAPSVVLLLAMSLALVFSAVRFHALALMGDEEAAAAPVGVLRTDP